MAKLMLIDQLLKATAAIGIYLEDTDYDTANLYVIVDPDGINLYVGKAASKRRHLDEDKWKELDYENNIVSGYPALIAENDAQRRPFLYNAEKFHGQSMRDHIVKHKWGGTAINTVVNRLDEGISPTVAEVEKILVRTHIRTGRLIGNSQFASQWETPIGTYSDTVAALVADAARTLGIIPQRAEKGTKIMDFPENESGNNQI